MFCLSFGATAGLVPLPTGTIVAVVVIGPQPAPVGGASTSLVAYVIDKNGVPVQSYVMAPTSKAEFVKQVLNTFQTNNANLITIQANLNPIPCPPKTVSLAGEVQALANTHKAITAKLNK